VVARRAHNPQVAGSTPAPATSIMVQHEKDAIRMDRSLADFARAIVAEKPVNQAGSAAERVEGPRLGSPYADTSSAPRNRRLSGRASEPGGLDTPRRVEAPRSLPCASCGELAAPDEAKCSECGADPQVLEMECETCCGERVVRYALGSSPWDEEEGTSTCPTCEGEGRVDAPFREEREAAA
jgi:hypothetical protein